MLLPLAEIAPVGEVELVAIPHDRLTTELPWRLMPQLVPGLSAVTQYEPLVNAAAVAVARKVGGADMNMLLNGITGVDASVTCTALTFPA